MDKAHGMTEAERFGAMMHRSADLKRGIATELAGPVIAVVDACEASLRSGGKLLMGEDGGSARGCKYHHSRVPKPVDDARRGSQHVPATVRPSGSLLRREPNVSPSEGDRFRDAVAEIFRAAKYSVDVEILIGHKRVDVFCENYGFGNRPRKTAIECKNWNRNLSELDIVKIWADYSVLYSNGLVDEIIVITAMDISPSAKAYVNARRELVHLTFEELQAQIVDFKSYLRAFIDEYERDGIDEYYIPSLLDNSHPAVDYIEKWIDRAGPPLAILASYGMGKTTTARRIAAHLARRVLTGSADRIPIYIQLQDIAAEQSLEGLLGRVLTARWPVRNYHFDSFMNLSRAGRLLIILDGFDEMKHMMSWDDFRANFRQLNRLVSDNAKVMLLGRPTAFLSEREHAFVLRGVAKSGDQELREPGWPVFEELKLMSLSEMQAFTLLEKYGDFRIRTASRSESYLVSAETFRERLNFAKFERLQDIINRPVQARMLCEIILDSNVTLRAFTVADLYEVFIRRIIGDYILDCTGSIAHIQGARREPWTSPPASTTTKTPPASTSRRSAGRTVRFARTATANGSPSSAARPWGRAGTTATIAD